MKKNRLNRLEFFKNEPVRFGFSFISLKLKKPNREKKPIKPIKILKKPTGSVRFQFYKPEIKKTEPDPTGKKLKKTEPNQKKTSFYSKITEPKPVGLNRFWFNFSFFLKKTDFITFFLDKKQTKLKINHP